MRNRYQRDLNRLINHPRRLPTSRRLRSPGGLASQYSAGVGLTRTEGAVPVELIWRSLEQTNDTGRFWEGAFDAAGAVSSVTMTGVEYKSLALYAGDRFSLSFADQLFKNDVFLTATDEDLSSLNDVRVIKNIGNGVDEIWISGLNLINAAVANVYGIDGTFLREVSLASSVSYAGGYIFLSVSPNYYAWADNGGIHLQRLADNSLVRSHSWCTSGPHKQTGLLDLTDELIVIGCESSIQLRLVADGSLVSVSLDMAYLNTFSQGIQAVQLTNQTLTVFGASRFIHYGIQRDGSGVPAGVSELARYEYDTEENYNLNVSSDRFYLNSVQSA